MGHRKDIVSNKQVSSKCRPHRERNVVHVATERVEGSTPSPFVIAR